MADLSTNVQYIKGIGEARAKSLQKLGITDLRALVSYFPRAYEDRRAYCRIADLAPGESACVRAVVASEPKLSHIRKGLDLVKFRAVDEALARAGDDAIVIGGASIYTLLLPYCERVMVTKVYASPKADSFFPNLDTHPDWRVESESELMEEDGLTFRFVDYVRK